MINAYNFPFTFGMPSLASLLLLLLFGSNGLVKLDVHKASNELAQVACHPHLIVVYPEFPSACFDSPCDHLK